MWPITMTALFVVRSHGRVVDLTIQPLCELTFIISSAMAARIMTFLGHTYVVIECFKQSSMAPVKRLISGGVLSDLVVNCVPILGRAALLPARCTVSVSNRTL